MKNSKRAKLTFQDDQTDLHNHGVQDLIPPNEEYYTLSLKRGNDNDVNDIPVVDLVGGDPFDEDGGIETNISSVLNAQIHINANVSSSSNAGGPVSDDNSVDQNAVSAIPGEPGHWGVDEGTD